MNNNELKELGILIGQVESLIEDLKHLRKVTEGEIRDLEARVANLEKKQYTIVILATIAWTGLLVFIKKIL